MNLKAYRLKIISCFFFYFLAGIVYSQITARMPALKAHANVDEGGVGLALACLGGGSLIGFATIAFLLKKLPSRFILTISAFTCLALFFATAMVFNLTTLCLDFALFGLAFAYFDVTMNTQIINLEIESGGQFMQRMHAAYNVGSLTGSISGAVFAFMAVGIAGNFISVAALFTLLTLLACRHLVEDHLPENLDEKAQGRHRIPLFVLICGFMALCAYTIEGSIAEWGGLVMHQEKGASEGLAALVYGSYSLVTAITRLNGDKLRLKLGDYRLLFFGAMIAVCGMLTVILSASPYVTLLGYALCGVGLAPLVPLLLSKVGHRSDITPAAGATVISLFGYGGMLIVPPSLGFLANHFGLINALLLPLFLISCVAVLSIFLRRLR